MGATPRGQLDERRIRYTVLGRWRGMPAEVSWESGRFHGPPGVLAEIDAMARPGDDLQRLPTALMLIGQALDQVDRLQVDDGENPWDFDARPIRPASAWRRRQMYSISDPGA